VTGCQLDVGPLATTLPALLFSHFFTQHAMYLLISQLVQKDTVRDEGQLSEALLKSGELPSFHPLGG